MKRNGKFRARPSNYQATSGQVTVEYILMIVTAVGFATLVIRGFIVPAYQKLQKIVDQQITDVLKPGNLHRLPFKH